MTNEINMFWRSDEKMRQMNKSRKNEKMNEEINTKIRPKTRYTN